jgi:hypothetical protein
VTVRKSLVQRTFYAPAPGTLSDQMLLDVLALVSVLQPPESIPAWSEMERIIAYDWAIREHLHASDNMVRRREKPSFLGA